MTKDEIQKRIYELNNDDEIIEFVKHRLQELEDNSIETTVGQNYTDTFREYISLKMHYKAGSKFGDDECPDLVYDDITPYVELTKRLIKDKWYNELTLFTSIFFTVHNYLPTEGDPYERAFFYLENKGKRISIKTIQENKVAFCSENAGMAHNLFKFLGVDSEVACGYRDSQTHAFNMVYPNGYGNKPMIIYDPSFFVNFVKDDKNFSLGYLKVLTKEDYDRLSMGEPIKIDLSSTERMYREYFGINNDFTFRGDEGTYIIGLSEKKRKLASNEEVPNELYYPTNQENMAEGNNRSLH